MSRASRLRRPQVCTIDVFAQLGTDELGPKRSGECPHFPDFRGAQMDLGPPDYVNSAALQRECLHSRRSSPTHGPLRARLQKLNSAHNVWGPIAPRSVRCEPPPAVGGGGHADREDDAIGALSTRRAVVRTYDAPVKRATNRLNCSTRRMPALVEAASNPARVLGAARATRAAVTHRRVSPRSPRSRSPGIQKSSPTPPSLIPETTTSSPQGSRRETARPREQQRSGRWY